MVKKFILDTNIFNEKKLLLLLKKLVEKNRIKLIISPIILLEYGYYQELHNKTQKFLRLIKIFKIEIEPVKKSDAIIAIRHCLIYKEDKRGASYYFRDALIAALGERLQIPIITNNINNFKGLPTKLKMTSTSAIDQLDGLL